MDEEELKLSMEQSLANKFERQLKAEKERRQFAEAELALIKGIRGTWDNDVKPEEMLGPGGDKKTSDEDKKDES